MQQPAAALPDQNVEEMPSPHNKELTPEETEIIATQGMEVKGSNK